MYGRGWHSDGPPRRARRIFQHGDLRFVVLNLLNERPRHGYEIIREIGDRVGGSYTPSPGVIYPTLTLLEELGHAATVSSDGARKLYTITDSGRQHLEDNREAAEAIDTRLKEAAKEETRGRSPQIMRAMENLRMALRLKLEGGEASAQTIDAITAAIDAAAQAIDKA